MTIPTLPETAPFSAAQRSWLNGFFAGLVSLNGGSSGTNPAAEAASPPVQEEEETFPWHDSALPLPDRMALAKDKPLERQMMAAMAQLDCGACGYVCQTYSEAIARGEEKSLTLCTPGGKETTVKLKELIQLGIKASPASGGAKPQVAETKTGTSHSGGTCSRKNPYPARLIEARPLNKPGSDKDTRHVVFDLKGSGLTYKPGDAMGLWPENCADLVTEILERLGRSGAEDVPGPDGQTISLYDALAREYAIGTPTDELFQLLGQEPVENVAVVDVVRSTDARQIDPAKFVAALSPMQPRLYSISSSLAAHPEQVHLTVGVVRYTNGRGTSCKGCASTYLAERIRPGQKARIYFHASKFGLPAGGDTPVIMVGPGTGIAPFRSFLHERKATGATGKNWLFFGDQKAATDFLYEDELAEMQACGTLTQLSTAFSRDQKQKVYVQTRMLEQAKELWAWLEQGAHFYVCGDAKRMAADVDAALKQVVADQGGMSAEDAAAYVANLTKTSRYQRDVY